MLGSQKGIKKIGKHKIDDLKKNQSLIKYDVIIEFYQNLRKKEIEQVEEDKKKKLKEAELWTRAQREEEKAVVLKYANDHGSQEMELIQKSIQEKQEKELKDKEMISTAKDNF